MSALAHILLEDGYPVSGSDLQLTPVTERLAAMGAVIYRGHAAAHVGPGVERVVVSTAIRKGNPEVEEARRRGLPVLRRAELLAELMRRQVGIAVAGAHGKTTTTAMVALVLEKNGLDPTVVVGGQVPALGGSARLGGGRYLVAEADESDGSFLLLEPRLAIVTNIENDHLDYYGTMEQVEAAFRRFIRQLEERGGLAVLCTDDPRVKRLADEERVAAATYGLTGQPDYTARALSLAPDGSRFSVVASGRELGEMRLSIPGRHNVLNALAACAVADTLGLAFSGVAAALRDFGGVQRRFQRVGEAEGVVVVDDYAHHPSEVRATLQAARQVAEGRVLVLFQPHRYTRTAHLHREFGPAFAGADRVLVSEIYSAGEEPIQGVSGRLVAQAVAQAGGPPASFHPTLAEAVEALAREVRPGDLVLTVGAGNVWQAGPALLERLAGGGKRPFRAGGAQGERAN